MDDGVVANRWTNHGAAIASQYFNQPVETGDVDKNIHGSLPQLASTHTGVDRHSIRYPRLMEGSLVLHVDDQRCGGLLRGRLRSRLADSSFYEFAQFAHKENAACYRGCHDPVRE